MDNIEGNPDRELQFRLQRIRVIQRAAARVHLERVAYHEAGHAVVALYSGLGVEYLTIRPSPEHETLGSVRPLNSRLLFMTYQRVRRLPGNDWRRRKVGKVLFQQKHARMRCHVAGSMAEQTRFASGSKDGSSMDRRMFHKDAKFFFGRTVGASDDTSESRPELVLAGSEILELRRRYEDECRQIFKEPGVWAWVEVVAQAALDHTTLSGGAINDLRPEQVDLSRVV